MPSEQVIDNLLVVHLSVHRIGKLAPSYFLRVDGEWHGLQREPLVQVAAAFQSNERLVLRVQQDGRSLAAGKTGEA